MPCREGWGAGRALLFCAAASLACRGASAENCGNFACSNGFTLIPFPATVQCSVQGASVCSEAVCCVEQKCGSDASALLAANNVVNIPDLSACDAVSEGSCASTCLAGHSSSGTPAISCVSSNTYVVTNPCTAITCPTPWGGAPALNIDVPSDALLATCSTALAAACQLACNAGYTGTPTLTCQNSGAFAVNGVCTEQSCGGFALSTGMVASTFPTACAVTGGTVLAGALRPVTQNQCTLDCAAGYTLTGSQVVACAPDALTPSTSLACTEKACSAFSIQPGMLPGTGADPCTIVNGKVDTLRPVSDPSCNLACAPGYQGGAAALSCSAAALAPTTTLTCPALQCTTGANAVTHTTVGVVRAQSTGETVSIGTDNTVHTLVVDAGHYCTGTPTVICPTAGANRYNVQGVTCQVIRCSDAFTDWDAQHVVAASTTACDVATAAGCPLACATGYKQGAGVPTLTCTGQAAFGDTVGTWAVTNPCVPISCSSAAAAAAAAAGRVVLPASIAPCDTVPEGSCALTCGSGYTLGQAGPPQLKCIADDTFELTNHCTVMCSDVAGLQITGGGVVSTGLSAPTTTTCAQGSGYLLVPSSHTVSCSAPPAGVPPDASRDCTAEMCCVATCGFAPCSASPGYTLKAGSNTIRCSGAAPSTCADLVCCNSKTCNPANAPTLSGATVSCASATGHNQTCAISPQQGYVCSGAVTCTAKSSDTGIYENTVSCGLAQCPPNTGPPPACLCSAGYEGTPSWGGTAWLHQCAPKQCMCTNIPNSEKYTQANSLCGETGSSITVVCKQGFTASADTTTCVGTSLTFTPVSCQAQACPATRVLNSELYDAADSITGTTGSALSVTCKQGYVGSGDGCPDTCGVKCDGFFFNSIVCNAVGCPANSAPPGTCGCNAGYSGVTQWDGASHAWAHACSATCGLYTCSSAQYTLKSPPNSHICGAKPSDCTDAKCCRGGSVSPTSLITSEDRARVTFTVVLVSQPSSDVTVPLSSTNTAEVRVLGTSITFTSSNWDVPQTVTVEGVPDSTDDADQLVVVTTEPCRTTDPDYQGVNLEDVSVTNLNQDTRDVHVSPRVLQTTEAGGQATFSVVLTTRPAAAVTIPVAVTDTNEGSVSAALLEFTPANWNINQTVVVTGLDDKQDDGNKAHRVLLGPASSTDQKYNSLAVGFVSVTNEDNDQAGVDVSPTSGLQTTEKGGTASFTVKLRSQPAADVKVPLTSSAPEEGTVSASSLTFTQATWDIAQTVVVRGVDDRIADGDVFYRAITEVCVSPDSAYAGLNADDVTLVNKDDDVVGYTVTPASGLVTTEKGASASFSLSLRSQPLGEVVVSAVANSAEVLVSPPRVVFSPSNFSTAQVFRVVGAEDKIDDGDQPFTITLSSASSDAAYNGNPPETVSGTNVNVDTAGINVRQNTTVLTTTEKGGATNYSVVLRSLPASPVTLTLSGDSSEGTIDPPFLRFNSRDWNIPQTVVVTGRDDDIDDGDVIYEIQSVVGSLDLKYDKFAVPAVSVKNTDDDVGGVTVSPTSGLFTAEYGASATFTVVLNTQPQSQVEMTLSTSNANEGNVAPASLIFSPIGWDTPRTVQVSGVQDTLQDGDVPYAVAFALTSAGDPVYNNLVVGGVAVTNLDDDTPGIIITPNDGLVTSEQPGSPPATFTVRLRSAPTADVTVPLVTDETEASLSPAAVTFTANDWSTPKTVSVSGVDDKVVDGNVSYAIASQQAQSADSKYRGLVGPDVLAVNIDDDVAGLTISPEGVVATSESGASAEVVVALSSKPTAEVSVQFAGDTMEVSFSPTSMVFSVDAYSTPQTLTVRGVDDDTVDGDMAHTIIMSTGLSLDPIYRVLPPLELQGVNADNDAAGVVVSPMAVAVSESGTQATLSVVLTSRPLRSVSFTATSTNTREGGVSPAALSFEPVAWNVPQVLTVTGVDDDVDDGNATWSVVLAVASSDTAYVGVADTVVSVVTMDDDTAGVHIDPTEGLVTTEAGGKATFALKLNTKPSDDVTLTLESGNTQEGSVQPGTVVFTRENWNIARTVTVTGEDDSIDDGNVTYSVTAKPAVSNDPRYDGHQSQSVRLVNLDDDTVGVVVSPTVGLLTRERGDTAVFSVRLNSQPTSGVSLTFSSSDTTEGVVPSPLVIFSPGNWDTPRNVTVRGVDDPNDDGNIDYIVSFTSVSGDVGYNNLASVNASITNVDDDVPGITVAPSTGLQVTEAGGTAEFVVVLDSMPEADVSVGLSSTAPLEGKVSPASLVFRAATWDTRRTVTVTGMNDDVDDGDIAFTIVTTASESADKEYNGLVVADVAVTNMDDDGAAVVISPTEGLTTSESGSTTTFGVKLQTEPTGDVSLTLASNDVTECSVMPSKLSFSPTNWSVPVTVLVSGVDDAEDDGDITVVISTSAAISSDPKYDGVNANDLQVVNRDNDTAGVTVSPRSGVFTSENGSTAMFTVVLQSRPTADVTIPLSSSNTAEGTVSPGQLTFTPAFWDVHQTVTVTGADDDAFDRDQVFFIVTGDTSSTDPLYNDLTVPDVQCVNLDNDNASVVVSPTEGLVVPEDGSQTASFTVVLTSRPTADVTIGVESHDLTEGTVSPAQIVFSAASWSTPASVTVTGVDDQISDGNMRFIVGVLPAVSSDEAYNGDNGYDVLVTNRDDDTVGLAVSVTQLRTSEGSTASFTVQLQSQPTAGVHLELSSSDLTEVSVSPETTLFTQRNWQRPVTVNVSGVYDNVVDGNRRYNVFLALVTKDPAYSRLQVISVPGVNEDMVNECYSAEQVCSRAGQVCNDTSMSSESVRDFVCQCAGSAKGSARGGVASCTYLDDCVDNGISCSNAGQMCVDPDITRTDDWRCECTPPQQSVGTQGRLSKCILDECTTVGRACEAAGQACRDPNTSPSSLGDWLCECKLPDTGSDTARIAACVPAGECGTYSTTCGAGQHCLDPNDAVAGDWMCVCDLPFSGSAPRASAQCQLDECQLHGSVCNAAGQTCADPNLLERGDWTCSCIGLRVSGTAVAMSAQCVVDECIGNEVCVAAGQTCSDPNTGQGSLDDWMCKCVSPAVGSARGTVAPCAFAGECSAFATVCTDAGQTCYDPSFNTLGDWQCRCVDPYEANHAVAQPATCVYDECNVHRDVCASRGQRCVDPNTDPRSRNDWRCDCIAPNVGSATAGVSQCSYVGECTTYHGVCEAVGQACLDASSAVGDWACRCVAPQTGTAQGAPATCQLDECLDNANVCAEAGQGCTDPDTSLNSRYDWRCQCVAPAEGSSRGRVAACAHKGECAQHARVCEAAGQSCSDTSDFANDWECLCLAPATGRATGTAAACYYNECLVYGSVCSAENQECNDPNTSPRVLNDWVCRCTGDRSVGVALGQPAVCILDECLHSGTTCTAVGQVCADLNTSPARLNDWQCTCVLPATGVRDTAAATCTYSGACVNNAATCTTAGQSCIDDVGGAFACACLAPQQGRGNGAPASCILDECTLFGDTCLNQGQQCVDVNTAVSSTGDWVCQCMGSGSGSAEAQVAACIFTDECALRSHICTAAGQTCIDQSSSRTGDWECLCVPPYTGTATASIASCVLDECTQHGDTCTAVGQSCTDPDTRPASTGDWVCTCVGSTATGTGVAQPATCTFNECDTHGEVCRAQGQLCEDPNLSPSSTDDWRCVCVSPATGQRTGAVATCAEVGECLRFGNVCTSVGQSCRDLDTSISGNWQCECLKPYSGVARGRAATCTVDECVLHGRVCRSAGQTCKDPSDRLGDWTCDCVAPATGQGKQQAAVCTYQGECKLQASTCAASGQACTDPDTTRAQDWQCVCPSPLVGVATGGVAVCKLDECLLYAATCTSTGQQCIDPNTSPSSIGDWQCRCTDSASGFATAAAAQCFYTGECALQHSTCTSVGQSCYDPNPSKDGDWECVCVAPQSGKGLQQTAECLQDECKQYGNVCVVAVQSCDDPNKSPSSLGDWRCECLGSSVGSAVATAAVCTFTDVCAQTGHYCTDAGQACVASTTRSSDWHCECVPPFTGRRFGGAASCALDECVLHSEVCRARGQFCRDPNTSPSSTGDWICECVPPATGSAVAHVATCVFSGECVTHSSVCTSAGQTCQDPNQDTANDWECACVMPAVGVASGKPATCEMDECIQHGDTCQSVGQLCHDPTPLAAALGDWMCRCVGSSASGTAVARPATCVLDECTTAGQVCLQAGQECHDTNVDPESSGDWVCSCPGTSPRDSVQAGVATCVSYAGMCASQGTVCAAAGQTCHDDANSTVWGCSCPAPYAGNATARPAACTYDECTTHRHVCEMANQQCIDTAPDTQNIGDWSCVCVAPLQGSAVAAAAECAHAGECAANAVVCTTAGQDCHDPSAVRDDWTCVCKSPNTGAPGLRAPALCALDECTVHGSTCEASGQLCVDPDKRLTSTQDWRCACLPPSTGFAVGGAAVCKHSGECAQRHEACTAVGQSCVDPSEQANDWECRCVPPKSGSRAGAPAACIHDECSTRAEVCTAVGQRCRDPDMSTSSTGDWLCECISPAAGFAVGKAAVCANEGECATQGPICTAAGQTCTDPDINTANNWECACVSPQTGRARGAVALCSYDECVMNGNVCTDAGQLCHDVVPLIDSLNDWICSCVSPAVGSAAMQKAVCMTDECEQHGRTCAVAGQTCHDPLPQTLNDWECSCIPPQSGTLRGGLATCTYDECTVSAGVCSSAGQRCNDPNPTNSNIGDWTCECLSSGSGNAQAKVAECTHTGECAANAHICNAAGQACYDPNPSADNDWECVCVTPLSGTASLAVATCAHDECLTYGSVCTAAGQDCRDDDTTAAGTGNWECVCRTGTASAVASVASCKHDECIANGATCLEVGQECHDPNTTPQSRGDWSCRCAGSAVGAARTRASACVYQGECHANAAICILAGQTCYDPDVTKAGDWMCVCVAPSTGTPQAGAPAQCAFDECALGGGMQCLAAGQTCVDVVPLSMSLGDWICECASAPGIATASVAVCNYTGECAVHAQTCMQRSQACVDTDPRTDGTWRCDCASPAVLNTTSGLCMVQECAQYGSVCSRNGQVCNDPDTSALSLGDWTCTCTGELSGVATARPASCVLDECVGNNVCAAAGQVCRDMNTSALSRNDWRCVCDGAGTGHAVGTPAICTYVGPCANNFRTCSNAGQACFNISASDWGCRCLSPQHGKAKSNVATCRLNECTDHWKTCAAAGQECHDPNTFVTSRNDWQCLCTGSAQGSAVGAAASCTAYSECATHAATCSAQGMACTDPSLGTNDWRCDCVSPTQRGSDGCVLDECTLHESVCRAAGQTCHDASPAEADWMCLCLSPAKGFAVRAAATCTEYAECALHAHICADSGQACYDPTGMGALGDWGCECIAPFSGKAGGTAATCTLDECALHGSRCTSVGQVCRDPNTAATSLDDWLCTCVGGEAVSAVASPAVCLLDECFSADRSAICTASGQRCIDPNPHPAAQGDWLCQCIGGTGSAVGAAATCSFAGECGLASATCASAGQTCIDPSSASDDWSCECVSPAAKVATQGKLAVCELDECVLQGSVCNDAGQECLDPNVSASSLNDWTCKCTGGTGSAVGRVADCVLPPVCTQNAAVCTAAGQACVSDETSMTWACSCVAPATGANATEAVARCELDECALKGSVCAAKGQVCTDTHRSTLDDWLCTCQGSGVGVARGRAAECTQPPLSKCFVNAVVCERAGQVCTEDANDWYCECLAPLMGKVAGGAAGCVDTGECYYHGANCTDAGQLCVDPDRSVTGDWQCECQEPLVGSARAQAATCAKVVENTAKLHISLQHTADEVRQRLPELLEVLRATYGLASAEVYGSRFSFYSRLPTTADEGRLLDGIVSAINSDSDGEGADTAPSVQVARANLRRLQWYAAAPSQARKASVLNAPSGSASHYEFEVIGSNTAQRGAWLNASWLSQAELATADTVQLLTEGVAVHNATPPSGVHISSAAVSSDNGTSTVELRLTQPALAAASLPDILNSRATTEELSANLTQARFAPSLLVVSASDCAATANPCGTQLCSDIDTTANGIFTCTCVSPASGTAQNAQAVCTTPAPQTGVPDTPSPVSAAGEGDDDIAGMSRGIAIMTFVLVGVAALLCFGVLIYFLLCRSPPDVGSPSDVDTEEETDTGVLKAGKAVSVVPVAAPPENPTRLAPSVPLREGQTAQDVTQQGRYGEQPPPSFRAQPHYGEAMQGTPVREDSLLTPELIRQHSPVRSAKPPPVVDPDMAPSGPFVPPGQGYGGSHFGGSQAHGDLVGRHGSGSHLINPLQQHHPPTAPNPLQSMHEVPDNTTGWV